MDGGQKRVVVWRRRIEKTLARNSAASVIIVRLSQCTLKRLTLFRFVDLRISFVG